MEFVLLAIVMLEGCFITYLLTKKKPELTIEQKEIERQKRIDKSYQQLFNYTEKIATEGYKDEE